MNNNPDGLMDDLAAYALGALEPEEQAPLEARLPANPELSSRLAEYQAVLGLLAFGLEPVAPPAESRAFLLAQARAAHVEPEAAPPPRAVRQVPRPAPPAPTLWQRVGQLFRPLAGVAAAALLLALLLWNVQLQRQLNTLQQNVDVAQFATLTQGRIISLGGTGQPGASARVYLTADEQRAALAVAGLPPLPEGRIYQLWFAQPDQPTITGGAFRVDASGEVLADVIIPAPLENVTAIAITEEPAPGSLRPTGEHLLDLVSISP